MLEWKVTGGPLFVNEHDAALLGFEPGILEIRTALIFLDPPRGV
jgi:hypothetical protein